MRIVLATSLAFGLCAAAPAAPGAPPASATAVPDFSGFFVRVGDLWFDPILDDKEGKPVDRLQVKGPDADDIWAGDFDNPMLQSWAREIVKRNAQSEIRLEHVHTADDSCWPSGVPQAVNLIGEVQFLQAKDRVVILYQRDHQVRRVWLNRDHSAHPAPSWYGESVGHYEGDTLVVDTIGLNEKTTIDGFHTPHTKQLHVVERFHLVDGGRTLEVNIHVEDPGAFTMPWDAIQRYRGFEETVSKNSVASLAVLATPEEGPLMEAICAENPNSFFPGQPALPIPKAAVPDF